MKKLKAFMTEQVSIPMWAILLFDFLAIANIVLNMIVIRFLSIQ